MSIDKYRYMRYRSVHQEVTDVMYESREYAVALMAERDREARDRTLERMARAACDCAIGWTQSARRAGSTAQRVAGGMVAAVAAALEPPYSIDETKLGTPR
jgi:hypothetical protein